MDIYVEKIDHENAAVQKRLFDFLAPNEHYCLFITGNLKMDFPDSHIYVAIRGNSWVGVAAYYGVPRSVVPFTHEPQVARSLIRKVAEHHPAVSFMCAISRVAEPACDELRFMGYKLLNDPWCVFMQLDKLPPPQPFEEFARLVTPDDHPSVARLIRYLHRQPQDPPLTEEELRMVAMNPSCYVLTLDGAVISTASTNGMGIAAFQIIGVSTHPEHRNKGYAGAVCAFLIRAMWNNGARRCVLFTEKDNLVAQACYRKLGFHTTDDYWLAKLEKAASV
jgi:ribosomal protein S18 acetylase RimI-like enzyme